MIAKNLVNHRNFVAGSEITVNVMAAKTVSKNIAYNYSSAQSVVSAWLNSPAHKENIEGNFTHFGIYIRSNTTIGKLYGTNIFARS
jgi:uncharacterized protein YkwD